MDILFEKCISCNADAKHLTIDEINKLYKCLNEDWKLIDNSKLEKTYEFSNFQEALDFTVEVGNLAKHEEHHPDIYLSCGKVILTIWTKKIKGLDQKDFLLASKIDNLKNI